MTLANILEMLLASFIWVTGAFTAVNEGLRGQITSYPAMCSGDEIRILPLGYGRGAMSYDQYFKERREAREGCRILPLNRATYTLNQPRGEVYYQSDFAGAQKLVNCAIINRANWTCEYPDFVTGIYESGQWGSGKVAFVNGIQAIGLADAQRDRAVFYMRRWQWHTVVWLGNFRELFGQSGLVQASWLIPEQKPF